MDKMQDLIDRAAEGDSIAAGNLKRLARGNYVAPTKPKKTGEYEADPHLPQILEELRHKREYDAKLVETFVSQACNEKFLPPGAAMMLFVFMCTRFHSAFRDFGGTTRLKLMSMYRFWDEAHHWVKSSILFQMREQLYQQHHRVFCQGFEQKARQIDKLIEEERSEERE